jgi:colanic acid/amylovoran biosynthesis glycosyltransferase
MRICITRSEKYAYSETFIRNIIKGLAAHAEVFTIHSGRLPERHEDGSLLSPKPIWAMHKFVKLFVGRNNVFGNYGVSKFLKENKIEVVFANYGISAAHMVPVCRSLNIPLIAIFHGHDATDKKLLHEYRKKYFKLFEYASYIVAVSGEMKQRLINVGADAEKIRLVPYGIDISLFKPEANVVRERNILAVGRFTAKKGPLHTIRAFHQVQQSYPDAKLTMVGKKSGLFFECEKLVAELGMKESVVFTGVLGQDEIADLMRSSLAYVQHSITAPNGDMEGTPLSILEAGASGLPIVSTLHGGIKEAVIHGETGFLVEEKNEADMAKYIMQLFENPDRAKEMGLKGRQHIEANYQNKEQIKRLYQLLNDAVV